MATDNETDPQAPAEEKRRERFRVLDLSAVGLAFPIALLLGYFGGRLVGGWLGSAQIGGLVGALVGIAAGFYNLLKMASRLAPKGASTASPTAAEPGDDPAGTELPGDDLEDDFLDDEVEDGDRGRDEPRAR